MYSFFDYEHIDIIDWDGLVEFFDWVKAYRKKNENKENEGIFWFAEKMLNRKEKTLTFENWDNIKLISYWYDDQVLFFKLIAPYIVGSVHWTFESPEEIGNITFEKGECIIEAGQMDYSEWGASVGNLRNKDIIDTEIQKRLIVDTLEK